MNRPARLVLVGALGLTALCLVLAVITGKRAHAEAPACEIPQVHYAPVEDLERIDVGAIDAAMVSIDMAAYTITDWPVLEALQRAAVRGVAIRLLVDRTQLEDRPEAPPLIALQDMADKAGILVALRVKRDRTLMHLKSYAIDGRLLRTGSANFSASGLKRQDNDLLLFRCPAAAARFKADFEAMWSKAGVE